MDDEIYRKILDDGKMQFEHEFTSYISDLRDRTCDINNFITISELETKHYNMKAKAEKIISNATSNLLSNLDDGELIESKKKTSEKRI